MVDEGDSVTVWSGEGIVWSWGGLGELCRTDLLRGPIRRHHARFRLDLTRHRFAFLVLGGQGGGGGVTGIRLDLCLRRRGGHTNSIFVVPLPEPQTFVRPPGAFCSVSLTYLHLPHLTLILILAANRKFIRPLFCEGYP